MAMLVAVLVLAVLAGPASARRHAPDLREDEPARRTTRPAGEYRTLPSRTIPLNTSHQYPHINRIASHTAAQAANCQHISACRRN